MLVFCEFGLKVCLFCLPNQVSHVIFRSSVIKPVVVGTALLGFSEKFIALLESFDDVAIEPVSLGLTLPSLCLRGRNLSTTPWKISYQVSTTSSGSSKINAESHGASFNAAINCHWRRGPRCVFRTYRLGKRGE